MYDIICPECQASIPYPSRICLHCLYLLKEGEITKHPQSFIGTKIIDRYHILDLLGSGGFASVYKAFDEQRNMLVALKCTNLAALNTEQIIDATATYNREVALLSQLSHPQIPHIYAHFSDATNWYIVMQYIEGQTLEAIIQSHLLPLLDVLSIGISLCNLLTYLHTQDPPIIYRDLKPANIIRDHLGRLHIVDFGSARTYRDGSTKDTIPFGSPGYAPPEQYGKAQTTPQSDIYSLGAVLHHLLTGNDPSESPFHFAPLPHNEEMDITDMNHLIQHMVNLPMNTRPGTISKVEQALLRIQRKLTTPAFIKQIFA